MVLPDAMTRLRSRALAVGLLAVLGVIAVPDDAEAAGYLTARYGTDYGTPATANGYAIYYNPAALGGTQGTTITGDVSLLGRFIRYTRPEEALSPSRPDLKNDPAYVRSNTGTANLSNFLALPFLGIDTDFGTSNLHAGYAFYVPFGGSADWTRRAGVPGVPGSTDGPQRWATVSGSILAAYNTFALAYRIQPAHLSIGASFSPIIHSLSVTAARNADGSDDSIANGIPQEGRVHVDGTSVNFGASFGLYWEPIETLHLGVSYISQPGFGETRISGHLHTALADGKESVATTDFLQTYPDIIRFGVAFDATPRLTLRGDFDFERWSVLKSQCIVEKGANCDVGPGGQHLSTGDGNKVQLNIPRNWNNAFSVRAGPAFKVIDNLELHGSFAVGTSAVPNETIDATTFDSTALFLTVGARFRATEHLALGASYNHVYYFTVNTEGKSNTDLANHPDHSYDISRAPSADGRYRSQVGFLNLNVAYTF
jgi:long-chain fatty acid transport protein